MEDQKRHHFYHAVWATKLRRPLLHDDLRPRLHGYLLEKIAEYGGIAMAAGGTEDHAHIVFAPAPDAQLAPFIGRLKGSSSHWVNHFYAPGGGFAWQRGYGLHPAAGEELAALLDYVRAQPDRHRRGETRPEYEDTARKEITPAE